MKQTRSGLLRRLVLALLLVGALVAPAADAYAGDAALSRELTDRGIALQRDGNHLGAVELFDAALVEFDHPKIRYFRAKSLRALERYEEALAEFELIKDMTAIAKYREEVLAFISDIRAEREGKLLEAQLAAEREARERAERERRELAEQAEAQAAERLEARRTDLRPTPSRDEDTPMARIVPLVPTFNAPMEEYGGAIEAIRYADALDTYQTKLTVSKTLTVLAVVGVSVGVGLGVNPLADGDTGDGARQAGLAVGVVGLVSGLAAAVLWPSEPEDVRASHRSGADATTPRTAETR